MRTEFINIISTDQSDLTLEGNKCVFNDWKGL